MIPAKQRRCLAKQTEGLRGNALWREPGVVYLGAADKGISTRNGQEVLSIPFRALP